MSAPANEDSANAEAGGPPSQNIHREKPVSKVVRVLTVLAYLFSVSFAAILLSVYYICVWKSPELPELDNSLLSARQGDHNEYDPDYSANVPYNFSGRSNSTVSDSTEASIENIEIYTTNSSEFFDTTADVLNDMESLTTNVNQTDTEPELSTLNVTTVT